MAKKFTDEQLNQLRAIFVEEHKKYEEQLLTKVKALIVTELQPLKEEVRSLKAENRSLRARLLRCESHSRRSNMEIVGFPLKPEMPVEEIVSRIANQSNYQLTDGAIVTAHRNGMIKKAENGTETQNIVVEFRDRKTLGGLLDAVKALSKQKTVLTAKTFCSRAPATKVMVFRQIPKEMKRLRWLARKKKEELGYAFCWITASGKLMMRKTTDADPIWISTEEDLGKLK